MSLAGQTNKPTPATSSAVANATNIAIFILNWHSLRHWTTHLMAVMVVAFKVFVVNVVCVCNVSGYHCRCVSVDGVVDVVVVVMLLSRMKLQTKLRTDISHPYLHTHTHGEMQTNF